MGEQAKKNFIINVIFILLWAGIIVVTGKFLIEYMLPFLIALAVAAFMQKPAKILSRKTGIKKGILAALLSAVLYIALAAAISFAILKIFSLSGKALSSLSELATPASGMIERLKYVINSLLSDISPETQNAGNKIMDGMLENITKKLSAVFSSTATEIVKAAPDFLFSSIVALAASCYIAKDFDRLKAFIKGLITEKTSKALREITHILKTSVFKILVGYLILMIITFLELCIGLAILGVKKWLLLSAIIAVMDILPVLGAGAFLIPWGLVSIITGNKVLGLGLIILYLLITVIRNLAEPKIVGNQMGINPLFILLALFSGLRLFGVAGLIIFPVTFIVVVKYYKNEMELS